jgi:MOSC domain-containing protein YiiM
MCWLCAASPRTTNIKICLLWGLLQSHGDIFIPVIEPVLVRHTSTDIEGSGVLEYRSRDEQYQDRLVAAICVHHVHCPRGQRHHPRTTAAHDGSIRLNDDGLNAAGIQNNRCITDHAERSTVPFEINTAVFLFAGRDFPQFGFIIPGMQLTNVNLGIEKTVRRKQKAWTSGIYKISQPDPVQITRLGLVGDVVIDAENHGGEDQAVYIYTADDYDWWTAELGREIGPGTFGENLTIRGLESADCAIGDRLQIGPVLLEVTAPRIPCSTLAARMEDGEFVKRFRGAARPGLYCRVIEPGMVQAGMRLRYTKSSGPTVTIVEMFEDFYAPELTEAAIQRFLDAPIAIRSRIEKEEQLSKLRK